MIMAHAPLRLGVLGAAKIARSFMDAVRPSPKVVVAVASRDAKRASAFARDTGVLKVHASHEALLANPAIEAVYVPLPNNLHAT
jgi:predicted dehydrogenase